jgi:hypothetical protein
MDDDRILNLRIRMIESLKDAIKEAGGRDFKWDELKNMSVGYMVTCFAQNDIVFKYDKE